MAASVDPVELLIFDCDGVLVDSERLACRVLADAVTRLGYPMTESECLERFSGISMPTVLARIQRASGKPLPEDFEMRLRELDRVAFERELRAVPGVVEALVELPYRRCVASSGAIEKMRMTLGLTGLIGYFEPHLFSAQMVARGKPAPDLFLFAAERMGVSAHQCAVIEDSLPGVEAGLAAGMRVFGFAGASHCGPDHAERLRQAGATCIFTLMAELPVLAARQSVGPRHAT
jgi:HAD superfamily hydrolase (TIGR01509 family)